MNIINHVEYLNPHFLFKGEYWESIKDYHAYQISNYGRVKSLLRKFPNGKKVNTQRLKILKPQYYPNQYVYVSLCKLGIRQNIMLHRLVGNHFIPKIIGKPILNHKDFDKSNNHTSNLEWCTVTENVRHGLINKGHSVIRVNKLGEILGTYISSTEAGKHTGIYRKKIRQLISTNESDSQGNFWKLAV